MCNEVSLRPLHRAERGDGPIRLSIVVACSLMIAACRPTAEMILVVDSNLTSVDVDEVSISVSETLIQTADVALGDAGVTFPLTLGLLQDDSQQSLQVVVSGKRRGRTVVEHAAQTSFAGESQKMLPLDLLDTCVGVLCPSNADPLTCVNGSCVPSTVLSNSLPNWTGALPPRPAATPAVPIGGRTLWANGWHSCANEGGVLYCWGQNSDGEIGDGTQVNADTRRPVLGLDVPVTVGLGELFSCTCDRGGQAWCWGRNVEGELGQGSSSATSTSPVAVPRVTDCAQIAGGANHACVVHGDGTLSCWGSNASGQLGQAGTAVPTICPESASNATVPCLPSPTLVPNLGNVVEVGAGEQYTCVRKSDQTVECWGDNTQGQLGDGTTTSRSTPAPVASLAPDVVELAVGRFFACARHADGTVSCWGNGTSGQLGNGGTKDAAKPVTVVGVSDAIALGLGREHTCVLRSSGSVWCWGGNEYGQVGNGTLVNTLSPTEVSGLGPTLSIAVGSVHTCARSMDGGVYCWGEDLVNELGDGATTNRSQPGPVAGFM